MQKIRRPKTNVETQEEKIEDVIAQEVGISPQRAEELSELIFRRIVLNHRGMSCFDYYLGVKELSPERAQEYDQKLYDTIQDSQSRLFIELMLVHRYETSTATASSARAQTLMEQAEATRELIESEKNKVIPIQRAARKRAQKTIKLASIV